MKHRIKFAAAALAASGMAAIASPAFAVSYASAVRNTGGAGWEFVLNESADTVTILRDGGNPLTLTTPVAGRHTFDMSGFTNFEIKVAKNANAGWALIGDPSTNAFANFERPSDIIVNTIPSSPYFGTVYVNNVRTAATAAGRAMGDGVYALTSDLIGVDLVTKAAVANANDASLAKAPGWNVSPAGTLGADSSAWRMTLDNAGNLIAGDWSDANGGMKYASPNLTTGGSLFLRQDGLRPLLTNGAGQEVHGSIVSTPYVTGTVGVDLTVYAIDEDLNPAGATVAAAGPGNSLWKWNVGAATNYDGAPELIINAGLVAKSSDGRTTWFDSNNGVNIDAIFSPTHNKWYMIQPRADGREAGIAVVSPTTGGASTVEWSSLQFSIDNNLDGHATVANTPNGQDVFRDIRSATLSPDGTKLYVARNAQLTTSNPVLGTTDVPGAVMIIPLDANGIPDLDVVGGKVVGLDSFAIASNTSGATTRPLTLDAAGNVYVASSASERLQVFSPGGNWLTTTTSAGTFTVAQVGGGLAGDFNVDGKVDGADFLVWQRGGSPSPLSQTDLTLWKNNYPAAAAPVAAAVPEPATFAMAGLAVAALAAVRRRNR